MQSNNPQSNLSKPDQNQACQSLGMPNAEEREWLRIQKILHE